MQWQGESYLQQVQWQGENLVAAKEAVAKKGQTALVVWPITYIFVKQSCPQWFGIGQNLHKTMHEKLL